jgi:hypothetical protein
MKAEEVYNIAIHLSENELVRLYTLLEKKISKKQKSIRKPRIKKKLITDEEALRYVLKTVFKVKKL